MNWFAKFEKKFSKYAIKNLMFYIIVLYAIGFVMNTFFNGLYDAYFSLDFAMIFKGQVWRLVTFILQPPSNSIIFVVFVLYFYYLIGSVLERIWGSFRFNVYFFTGVILNILASLIIYLIWGLSFKLSTNYINLALFMAFAMEQPDMEVLLFFIIPIKIKWMAILDAVIFGITIVFGYLVPFLPRNVWYSLYAAGFLAPSAIMCYANATAALVSMLNFIIFFFLYKKGPAKSSTQRNFDKAMRTAKKAQRMPEKSTGSRIVATLRAMVVSHYMEISLRIVRHNKVRHNTRSAACRSTDVQYAEGQNLTTKTSHSDSAQNASATTNTVPTTYIPTSM